MGGGQLLFPAAAAATQAAAMIRRQDAARDRQLACTRWGWRQGKLGKL